MPEISENAGPYRCFGTCNYHFVLVWYKRPIIRTISDGFWNSIPRFHLSKIIVQIPKLPSKTGKLPSKLRIAAQTAWLNYNPRMKLTLPASIYGGGVSIWDGTVLICHRLVSIWYGAEKCCQIRHVFPLSFHSIGRGHRTNVKAMPRDVIPKKIVLK